MFVIPEPLRGRNIVITAVPYGHDRLREIRERFGRGDKQYAAGAHRTSGAACFPHRQKGPPSPDGV